MTESEHEHEVMARCVEAWNLGGSEAVEEVLRSQPELAPRLRERLAKLERAGLLGPSDEAVEIPERLGEFKLLRRLGSGGMGVVFVAEQLTLGRTVAVKLMRPEQRFFPGARARFQREVEAIARLGDPGIVPIYSVGQEQGIDFFAMEHVRGASLGEVIAALHGHTSGERSGRDIAVVAAARGEVRLGDALPELFTGTWLQACCRIVVRMARAVQHAHERGVVHRDLKPNNAMVTAEGRVLLLDFGLASASGASRITRTGAQLGTLCYMAPEQLAGGEVDARTDVYALGVTLFELLALRSPFGGAESDETLRWQIANGRGAALRQCQPEAPLDVQTIVATAMERDPGRRYATAAALADDLESFLQHRPIAARPIGPMLRMRRWSQRHPAWATALALGLVAAVATPFLVRFTRGTADQEIAEAREQARSNLRSARAVLERIVDGVQVTGLNRAPALDAERRRQLEEAVGMVRRLAKENPDDRDVQTLFVDAMRRAVRIRTLIGDDAGALAAADEVTPVLQRLRDTDKDDPTLAASAAGLLLARGTALGSLGRNREATVCWQQVVDAFDARPVESMGEELAMALWASHNNLAGTVRRDSERAMAHLRRALALEQAVWPNGLPPHRVVENARGLTNLGVLQIGSGDRAGARRSFTTVIERVRGALVSLPEDAELLRAEARAQWGIAQTFLAAKDYAAAARERTRAVEMMRAQAQRFPGRQSYVHDVATMLVDLAGDHELAHDTLQASLALADAITLEERLVEKAPENLEYRLHLALALRNASRLQYDDGEREEALAQIAHAIDVIAVAVAKSPLEPRLRAAAAECTFQRAAQHIRAERWEPANTDLLAGKEHYETALANGLDPGAASRFQPMLILLARTYLALGDLDAVVATVRRAHEWKPMPAPMLRQLGGELKITDRDDFQALLGEDAGK